MHNSLHASEKLVIDTIARQFKVSLLHHSVLHRDSNADLSLLVYFITQVCIFQLQQTVLRLLNVFHY